MTDHAKEQMQHARAHRAPQRSAARRAQMWLTRQLHSLRTVLDVARDKRIAGVSLEENVISPFAESHGAIDTIHTPYGTLGTVLGQERFSPGDAILDVGCGLGRPLAYLVDTKFPGQITGVEINPEVAERAAAWAQRYENVTVIGGDAFLVNLDAYTHLFMWRPFTREMFERFILKIECELSHPLRVYYLSDTHTGDFPEGRPGWHIARRSWVHYVHGLPQHGEPERYTVWDYTPPRP